MNRSRSNRKDDDCQQEQKDKTRQRLVRIMREKHVLNEVMRSREFCLKILQQIMDVRIRVEQRELQSTIYSPTFASTATTTNQTLSRTSSFRRNKIVMPMPCRFDPTLPTELIQWDVYEETSSLEQDLKRMTCTLKLAVDAKIQLNRQMDLIRTLETNRARRFEKILNMTLKALDYETGIIYSFLLLRCKCAFKPKIPVRLDRDFSRASCNDPVHLWFQLWPTIPGLIILHNFIAALQIFLIVAKQILWTLCLLYF